MVQLISILITLIMFTANMPMRVNAEESGFSISEAIREMTGRNDPEVLEKLTEAQAVVAQRMIDSQVEVAWIMHKSIMPETIQDQLFINYSLNPALTFKMYSLETLKYTKQYAKYSCFEDILCEEPIWVVGTNSEMGLHYYNMDYQESKPYLLSGVRSSMTMLLADKETGEFLSEPDAIEELVEEQIDEKIINSKIIGIPGITSFLYLRGETNDYGIIIYIEDYYKGKESVLEKFKVYTMEEIMDSTGRLGGTLLPAALEEKPVYDTEMSSLMEAGIIAGTDKGAEPLKPLNRIEATAILVRILGLENAQTSKTSYFTDIASDNWGAKYANIAYDAGITKGVENGNFAPNDKISASQFATLLLRSRGETNIDWQTAVNIFVERGIITQEQADKMDLFTRGDMAKIIYECRERGML